MTDDEKMSGILPSEAFFGAILDAAPTAVLVVSDEGWIRVANLEAGQLLGYEVEELLGRPVEMLIVPSELGRLSRPEMGISGGLSPVSSGAGVRLKCARGDGSELLVEVRRSSMSSPEGGLVVLSMREATEGEPDLDGQNRRMRETERLKGEFLANLSHELRTPLNAIIGFTQLLHSGKVGPLGQTQTEYLGDILGSSRHLLRLINDVLDLAKVEVGRLEIYVEQVDVAQLASAIREVLCGLAAETRVELKVEVDASLGPVVVDPRIVKQIMYNYLSNAIKFTPEGGRVCMRIASEQEEMFRVEVEDNGVGVRPEDMPRLFVEFHQLDSGTTSKRQPGTGLGLALTKRLVEALGGSVGVKSRFGEGSTFWAILPRAVPSPGG